MKRLIMLNLLATLTLGSFGCGDDPRAAERPADVGYVPPRDLPVASAPKATPAKLPAK